SRFRDSGKSKRRGPVQEIANSDLTYAHAVPESRISNLEPRSKSIQPIIRRFLRDRNVVHVRLAHTGAGNADEMRFGVHLVDGRAADVTHRGAQSAGELVHDAAQRSAVRNAALDAFRHEFVGVGLDLEITILRTLLHRAQRAHAAVALVRAALVQ